MSITTDNAPNIVNAVQLLSFHNDLNGLIHWRCVAHILKLIVKEGLKEDKINPLIRKVRFYCKKVHCSSKNKEQLRQQQASYKEPAISVVMDIAIRWNSTYDMLTTAIKMKRSLTFLSNMYKESYLTNEPLNECDWELSSLIVRLLEPFKQSKSFKY